MGSEQSHKVIGKEELRNSHPFQQGAYIVEQGTGIESEQPDQKNRRYIQSSFRLD